MNKNNFNRDIYEAAAKLKLLVFDLDGTLLDTLPSLAETTRRTLDKAAAKNLLPALNYEFHSRDEFLNCIGYGSKMQILKAAKAAIERTGETAKYAQYIDALSEVDGDLSQTLYREYLQEFENSYNYRMSPFGGVKTMLQSLKRFYDLAVLSNKPDKFTKALIAEQFGEIEFAAVLGGLDDQPLKPDSYLYEKVLSQTGHGVEESAMIGDGDTDIKTAANVGCLALASLWGYRDLNDLMQAGLDQRLAFKNPEEMTAFLLKAYREQN